MSDSSVKTVSNRPLSPHLQVYRLPVTALMSISHRLSGAVLVLGTLLFAAWLIAAATGPEYYYMVMGWAQTGLGTLILFGWSVALFYHMCNGIRHLLWDAGWFLSKRGAATGNLLVLLATALLTAAVWLCACWYA